MKIRYQLNHDYLGMGKSGKYQATYSPTDKLVIISEMPNNPGASLEQVIVTLMLEMVSKLSISAEELRWVEHLPPEYTEQWYDLVFEKGTNRHPYYQLKPANDVEFLKQIHAQAEREEYLEQVQQFYQQIQSWGTEQFRFTTLKDYPISDKTGDYQVDALAVLRPSATSAKAVIVTFLPHGITFFTGDGILEMQGAFLSEEIIYQQEGKRMYTERNGQECPMYEGFEGDGWYWMVRTRDYPRRMRRMTKEIFLDLVQRGANWSMEE